MDSVEFHLVGVEPKSLVMVVALDEFQEIGWDFHGLGVRGRHLFHLKSGHINWFTEPDLA